MTAREVLLRITKGEEALLRMTIGEALLRMTIGEALLRITIGEASFRTPYCHAEPPTVIPPPYFVIPNSPIVIPNGVRNLRCRR